LCRKNARRYFFICIVSALPLPADPSFATILSEPLAAHFKEKITNTTKSAQYFAAAKLNSQIYTTILRRARAKRPSASGKYKYTQYDTIEGDLHYTDIEFK